MHRMTGLELDDIESKLIYMISCRMQCLILISHTLAGASGDVSKARDDTGL